MQAPTVPPRPVASGSAWMPAVLATRAAIASARVATARLIRYAAPDAPCCHTEWGTRVCDHAALACCYQAAGGRTCAADSTTTHTDH